ncbi:MAG TPA: exodeoxyribonuclease VII small subunit [Chitinophagales bacterium]|nr:exodeoxyribonuclease VII small subunit [Chitinophagales bacterium]
MAASKAKSNQSSAMENKLTYTDAIMELESIVSEIENEDITVDELAEKVKRASLLIKICKDKLTQTEHEVNEVLKDLKSQNTGDEFSEGEHAPE